jgi:Barstar (barnase inhibitor)
MIRPNVLPTLPVHLIAGADAPELVRYLKATRTLVVTCDTAMWASESDALKALGLALQFPNAYGQNWDAFFDCFWESRAREMPESAFACVLTGVRSFAAHALEATLRTVHLLAELNASNMHVFFVA